MKGPTRKQLRIGLPVVLAALFFLQAASEWQNPEGFGWLYVGIGISSLVLSVIYWRIERSQQ